MEKMENKKKKANKTAEAKKPETAQNDVDISSKKVPFAIVESYKNLRTSIAFLLAENEGSSFTITSANAGEGKSTTSANLAVAFSQLEKKVLLVDADLRLGSLHKKFKLENRSGLADVLVDRANISDAIQAINPYLHVLTAGTLPPNPSELLDSKRFSSLMENLNSVYDLVIVDTPPINVVSDSLIVAPHTSGVILVIRDGITSHGSIKKALELMRFANVNILGSIMNGTNPRTKSRYVYRKPYFDTNNPGYRSGGYSGYSGYPGYRGGYSGYSGYMGYRSSGYGSYGGYGYGGFDRSQKQSSYEIADKKED